MDEPSELVKFLMRFGPRDTAEAGAKQALESLRDSIDADLMKMALEDGQAKAVPRSPKHSPSKRPPAAS